MQAVASSRIARGGQTEIASARRSCTTGSFRVSYSSTNKSVSCNFYPLCICFSYIDQGRNPQLYTKDCIEKALAKNEQVKGKIDAYRKFKANILLELSRIFPNELSKYRAIRGEE